ncbi:hypothetical protein [Paenibacillus albiflavus]|nr:hypothetical protein [Paenibacillus albiflavus]
MDQVGRLQLPDHYMEAANLKGKKKVKLVLDHDKIIVQSPDR